MPVHSGKRGMIGVSIGLLVVGLVGGYLIGQTLKSEDIVQQTATPAASEWKTYSNSQYGFEIQYLGTLEEDQGYIRMQNYAADDSVYGLEPGEYYLEIGPSDTSCQDRMTEIKVSKIGDMTMYHGYGEEGGDAGGIRFVFCANKGDRWVGGTVTEANLEGTLANQIISTFKFTK